MLLGLEEASRVETEATSLRLRLSQNILISWCPVEKKSAILFIE